MVDEVLNRFNRAYFTIDEYSPSKSLVNLAKDYVSNLDTNSTIAEFGCGIGSQFNSMELTNRAYCYDISPVAINKANKLNSNDLISFHTRNLITYDFKERFFLVLDSHLLHCITDKEQYISYLKNCYKSLSPNGYFVLETAISSSSFNRCFQMHLKNNVLYSGNKAIRTVLSSYEIERLLLEIGFKIEVLKVPFSKKFLLENFKDIPLEYHPDTLQVICKKPLD